jgi:hypothetical protein
MLRANWRSLNLLILFAYSCGAMKSGGFQPERMAVLGQTKPWSLRKMNCLPANAAIARLMIFVQAQFSIPL